MRGIEGWVTLRGLELHVGLRTGLAGAGQAWSGIPLGTWIGPRFLVWVQAGWHLLLWSHGEADNDRMWPPQDPHFSGAQACQPSPVHLQACFPAAESCRRTAKDILESPRAHSQAVTKHCLFSQGPSIFEMEGALEIFQRLFSTAG